MLDLNQITICDRKVGITQLLENVTCDEVIVKLLLRLNDEAD